MRWTVGSVMGVIFLGVGVSGFLSRFLLGWSAHFTACSLLVLIGGVLLLTGRQDAEWRELRLAKKARRERHASRR